MSRELRLIAALEATFGRPQAGPVELALGDDAAVVATGPGREVVSVDTMVDGTHFRRAWATPADVGHRALAAALSDLAGMGAAAAEAYLAVTLPPDFSDADVIALHAGAAALAAAHGVTVAGGDLVAGPALAVAVTVVGRVGPDERLLRRDGARPGDLLGITGPLGGAAAGLAVLQGAAGADSQSAPLVQAFLRPQPRLRAGRALAAAGASAGMDLSDGLARDAERLAERSGVHVAIDLTTVPRVPGVDTVAAALGADPVAFAAAGGEDYELLVAVPPAQRAAAEHAGVSAWVGRVEAGAGTALTGASATDLQGFEHFGP